MVQQQPAEEHQALGNCLGRRARGKGQPDWPTFLLFSAAARSWRLVRVSSRDRLSTLFAHSSICNVHNSVPQCSTL